MRELKQAIADNDCLMASLRLANIFQAGTFCPESYLSTIRQWANDARQHIDPFILNSSSFHKFIRYFYVNLAFSGTEQNEFSLPPNLLNQVMDYRTGIPVTLSIVFEALAKAVGFNVCGVNFLGHFILKCQFENEDTIYLDPLNGKQLQRQDLHALYFSILQEIENEVMPEEALNEASCAETIIKLLHNLKTCYMNEKSYAPALMVVEFLVALCPNNPYERRDRGFLLHKLDCTQVAIADYQYFIRKCPKDPCAEVLQVQLEQLNEQLPVVFH
ncbi:tetratricopeptide repeat protein [Paraglaciecola aquimarina]|uniref:Tetratricopeptide repeat protein n=1 Tax=Paraglaciecola aquimarina TaxID=1235557 RepID=A0ABU3T006_9ALTE|nr:tetratricopeptide repeat protein [Paraglaciecola aquimarina]MDU0355547.1 tetratricopeptide repeat protein [Paraglaciecola aquimarina]